MNFKRIQSTFKRHLTLYKNLYRDKRTPLIAKIFLGLAIGYALLPFDLIPDFIPVIGHLDDIIIIPGLIFIAIQFIPKEVYDKHRSDIFK